MTDIIDIADRDALALLLRSKTALGRLNDSEVHGVLAFLETIGFTHQAPAPVALIEPGPVAALTPEIQQAAQVAQVIPAVAPVSVLSKLETIIENDVKAFFEPAPLAPPPAQ